MEFRGVKYQLNNWRNEWMYALEGDKFLTPFSASSFKDAKQKVEEIINKKLEKMKITAYFDGCCEPVNPGGNMGFGAAIIVNGKEEFTLSQSVGPHPNNTNNVAEYQAFGWILKKISEMNTTGADIEILGDSKLVVNQMCGAWNINGGSYAEFAHRAKGIFTQLSENNDVKLKWISKNENELADDLSRTPLRKAGILMRR